MDRFWNFVSIISICINDKNHRLRSAMNVVTITLSIIIAFELNKTDKIYLFWIHLSFMLFPNVIYEIFTALYMYQGFEGDLEQFVILVGLVVTVPVIFPMFMESVMDDCRYELNDYLLYFFLLVQILAPVLTSISTIFIINAFKNDIHHSNIFTESYILFIINLISLFLIIYIITKEFLPKVHVSVKIEFLIMIIMMFVVFTADYNISKLYLFVFSNIFIVISMCLKLIICYKYTHLEDECFLFDFITDVDDFKHGNVEEIVMNKLCIVDAISSRTDCKSLNVSLLSDKDKLLNKDDIKNCTIKKVISYKMNSFEYFETLYNFNRTDMKQKVKYLSDCYGIVSAIILRFSHLCIYLLIFILYIMPLLSICYVLSLIDFSNSLSKPVIVSIAFYALWFLFSWYKTFYNMPPKNIRFAMMLQRISNGEEDTYTLSESSQTVFTNCRLVTVFDFFPHDIAYMILGYIVDDYY
eukprot:463701_1